jgi:anti-anti-sigma factor
VSSAEAEVADSTVESIGGVMSPGDAVQPTPRPPAPPEPLPRFRLTLRDLGGGFSELKAEGEIDLSVADRLKEQIAAAAGTAVLVDLSECTFIDSTGIAVVLLARRDGERVAIHSPSEQVRRVLDLTGLTGDGLVFDDRDGAMSGLSEQGATD